MHRAAVLHWQPVYVRVLTGKTAERRRAALWDGPAVFYLRRVVAFHKNSGLKLYNRTESCPFCGTPLDRGGKRGMIQYNVII